MLPGSGGATLRLHVHRLFWLCVSVCRLLVDRWGVPEAGHGDDGGVGLVSGPAGDHPDLPLCQRHGLQQGRRGCIFVFCFSIFFFFFQCRSIISGEVVQGTGLMLPDELYLSDVSFNENVWNRKKSCFWTLQQWGNLQGALILPGIMNTWAAVYRTQTYCSVL